MKPEDAKRWIKKENQLSGCELIVIHAIAIIAGACIGVFLTRFN